MTDTTPQPEQAAADVPHATRIIRNVRAETEYHWKEQPLATIISGKSYDLKRLIITWFREGETEQPPTRRVSLHSQCTDTSVYVPSMYLDLDTLGDVLDEPLYRLAEESFPPMWHTEKKATKIFPVPAAAVLTPEMVRLFRKILGMLEAEDQRVHIADLYNDLIMLQINEDRLQEQAPLQAEHESPAQLKAWIKAFQERIEKVAGRQKKDRVAICLGHFRDMVSANDAESRMDDLLGIMDQLAFLWPSATTHDTSLANVDEIPYPYELESSN